MRYHILLIDTNSVTPSACERTVTKKHREIFVYRYTELDNPRGRLWHLIGVQENGLCFDFLSGYKNRLSIHDEQKHEPRSVTKS